MGALAPPVASEPPVSLPPEDDFSDVFSDSPADVPPELSLDSEDPSLDSPPPVELVFSSLPADVFAAVEVVEVAVVSAASFSAEVSLGGVISGVLLGMASETLDPPQADRPIAAKSSTAPAASAAIERERSARLTRRAGPSADRRWGSR